MLLLLAPDRLVGPSLAFDFSHRILSNFASVAFCGILHLYICCFQHKFLVFNVFLINIDSFPEPAGELMSSAESSIDVISRLKRRDGHWNAKCLRFVSGILEGKCEKG